MSTRFHQVAVLAVLLAAVSQLAVRAQEPTPAVEADAPVAIEESIVSPSAEEAPAVISVESVVEATELQPAIECLPIHIVRSHYSFSAKRKIRCYGSTIQQTLCVKNPANCCVYAVNVCVPNCCVDAPVCCSSRVGLLGRGYVVYQWPCGYKVEVVFRVHDGAILNYK